MDRNYANALFLLLEKKLKLFPNSKEFDRDTIISIVEILMEEGFTINQIVMGFKELVLNERFFSIAALVEYIPKDSIDVDIISCLREAIGYAGLSKSQVNMTSTHKEYGKTNYKSSLDKMIELAGPVGGILFEEYALDFSRDVDSQKYIVEKIRKHWDELNKSSYNTQLAIEHLTNKYSRPSLDVDRKIKTMMLGGDKDEL